MGEPEGTPPADDSAPSLDAEKLRPRPMWPALVLLGLVIAAVSAFAVLVLFKSKPRPNRALLLVATEVDGVRGEWWGAHGRLSARCADAFAEQLGPGVDRSKSDGLGMDVVPAGDPDVLARLEGKSSRDELLAEASAMEVGLVVLGVVKSTTEVSLSGSDGLNDHAFELSLELAPTAEGAASASFAPELAFHEPGKTTEDALAALCTELPKRVLPALATAIADLPLIADLVAKPAGQRNLDETAAIAKIDPLLKLAFRQREATKKRAADQQALEEQDRRGEQGKLPKHALGAFLDEDYFVGPGPGDELLLMSLPRTTFLQNDALRFDMVPAHERLRLVGPQGELRPPLLECFNIYSYPSASPDGRFAVAVLDHRQWSKALVIVDTASGLLREVTSHRAHYFSTPRVSPDGGHIAFYGSDCRGCPERLELIGSDGSGRREILPGGFDRLSMPRWSPDGKKLYFAFSQDGGPMSVWAADVDSGERSAVFGVAAMSATPAKADAEAGSISSYDRPTPMADGSAIAAVEVGSDGSWIVLFDLARGTLRRLAQLAASHIEVSPDGGSLAVETIDAIDRDDPAPGDSEIALVSVATGEVRQLTLNGTNDDLAGFSRDGRRIYFHQGSQDPAGKHWDNRVYWLEP